MQSFAAPLALCPIGCQGSLAAALAAANSTLTPQCFEGYLDTLSAVTLERTTL